MNGQFERMNGWHNKQLSNQGRTIFGRYSDYSEQLLNRFMKVSKLLNISHPRGWASSISLAVLTFSYISTIVYIYIDKFRIIFMNTRVYANECTEKKASQLRITECVTALMLIQCTILLRRIGNSMRQYKIANNFIQNMSRMTIFAILIIFSFIIKQWIRLLNTTNLKTF